MGDPKKARKKYSTPMHPWNKINIDAEKIIKREYGLRNKKEILIANSFLKKYKNISKKLVVTKTEQAEKEKIQVLTKLQKLGLLPIGSPLDQILGLEPKDILERRLQSIVFRKGLAKTMNQARQFIIHRHIKIGNKEISMPSYIVSLEEESSITFKAKSALANEEHPERISQIIAVQKEIKAVENPTEQIKQAPETPAVKEKVKSVKEPKAEEVKEE